MKLIIRADDVGYTDVCNIGAFETIDHGVVTSADVMLDCPGTEDALRRLRDYPWISVGWHGHFWGAPVLDPSDVPSLYDPARNGFRKDVRSLEDVDYDEALAECRAQIERCIRILGKAPDTCGFVFEGETAPLARAILKVCEEYGINNDCTQPPEFLVPGADAAWDGRKILGVGLGEAYEVLHTDSITQIAAYDPIGFYTEDRSHMLSYPDDAVLMNCWHPGYVDYFVYLRGDYGPNALRFINCRTVDVHALCSQEVKDWLRDSGIELVNTRDAMYGTHEYQNHLRAIGSELYRGI